MVVWNTPYSSFLQILFISLITRSANYDLIWHVIMCFPPAKDQQWKSWTSYTVFSFRISFKRSFESKSLGENSMMMAMQSLNIGTVVNSTSTEKIYVHIGSAICHSGLNFIIIDAQITPILYTISPKICIIAARKLIFCFSSPSVSLFLAALPL